jgi:hypothetical protein
MDIGLSSDIGNRDSSRGAESVDGDNQEEADTECLRESSADSSGELSGVSGRDVLLCIRCSGANPQEGRHNTDGRDGVGSTADPWGVLVSEAGIDPSSDSTEVLSIEAMEDTCTEANENLCPDRDESGIGMDPTVDMR